MRANALLCQDWHSAVLIRLQFDVCQKSSRVRTLQTGAAESENNRRDDSLNPLSLKPLRWYPDSNEILHRRSGYWILISKHFMLKHVTHGKVLAKQIFLLSLKRELYTRKAMSEENRDDAKTWTKRRIQECAEFGPGECCNHMPPLFYMVPFP